MMKKKTENKKTSSVGVFITVILLFASGAFCFSKMHKKNNFSHEYVENLAEKRSKLAKNCIG